MSIQHATLRLRLWFLAVVLISGTLICMSPPASSQETVGSITNLEGSAILTRNGRQGTVTLAMAVEIKDLIETSASSDVTVTLIDHSELLISEKSSVAIGNILGGSGAAPTVSLLVGHARTKVESALRRVAPVFMLGTPNAITAARPVPQILFWSSAFDQLIVNGDLFAGCNVAHRNVDPILVAAKLGRDVWSVTVIDEACVIAAEDITMEPDIDIAVVAKALAKQRWLRFDQARVDVKVKTEGETPHYRPGWNRRYREKTQSVNVAPIDACVDE